MGELASAKTTAEAFAKETADVAIEYIVPLAGLVGGYFTCTAIGGFNGIYDMFAGVQNQVPPVNAQVGSTSVAALASGFIMAGIFAGIGSAFWSLGKREGRVFHAVGRFAGSYFFGAAARSVVAGLFPGPLPDGFIDDLIHSITGTAPGQAQ